MLAQSATTQSTSATTIVVPATVSAFYSAELYAKDSGYISEVRADIGDHVKKGDLLANIDDPELLEQMKAAEATLAAKEELAKAAEAGIHQAQAAVDVAKRLLAGAQAEHALAQATLKRQEALFSEKAATSQQIDEMRAKAQVAQSNADVAEAKIVSAEADLRAAQANSAVAAAQVRVAAADVQRMKTLVHYLRIVAPFDGVITRRWIDPGAFVQSAAASRTTPLFTCQKVDVVRIFCDVPESSLAGIHAGGKADVRMVAANGPTLHGQVTRISGALDPATRTMRVEIDLKNADEALRPGMYAQVTLVVENSQRLTALP